MMVFFIREKTIIYNKTAAVSCETAAVFIFFIIFQ